MYLLNCWEITNCGREKGGLNADELGVCKAYAEQMGRSCWAVAGTLCGGEVQGTAAQKERNCMGCPLFKEYNRASGNSRDELFKFHPDEHQRYTSYILKRGNP